MNQLPLITAILENNIAEIESLINSGANINQSWDGLTPIQYTVKLRKVKIAKLLIENNADLRIYDHNNDSPLEHILTKFKESSALSILKSLPDIHVADNYYGNTALHYVARLGYNRCIDYLINKGVNTNTLNRQGRSPIFYASKSGACQSIELLVSRGANIDLPDNVDKMLWSPIFYAVRLSDIEWTERLVKYGADVNLVDAAGLTPIFYALKDIKLVSFLARNGAQLDFADKHGATPIFRAVKCGNAQLVELLVRHGANVAQRDNNGWTPLQHAIDRRDERIVRILLECSSDVDYLGIIKNPSVEMTRTI